MRRRRRPPQISFDYFRVFTFGSEVELVARFGSLAGAARVWSSLEEAFMERWDLWGMPEAWWRFEPGIPDDLRSGPHAIITQADAAEWARLGDARRSHLEGLGVSPTRPRRFAAFGSG